MNDAQWTELVRSALVGSDRRPPPAVSETAWGPAGAALRAAEPAQQLLHLAAAAALYRDAGRTAPVGQDSLPAPAATTGADLPPCSARASGHLHIILEGSHRDLLPEWLRLAALSGQRAAAAELPSLLNAGCQKADLQPLIRPVLGARGQWLAAQNEEWTFALPALTIDWQTGDRVGRVRYLRRLRREDAQSARHQLQAAWPRENAASRLELLAALSVGLTAADEAFLAEVAAADRSRSVRELALDLLAALPDADLFRRTLADASELLTVRTGQRWLRRGRVEVTLHLPQERPALLSAAGVPAKPPDGREQRAWWAEQLIGLVPPAWWCEQFATDAATLLDGADSSQWREILLAAWAAAAARHRDEAWAFAWLASTGDQPVPGSKALMNLLPPSAREEIASKMLRAGSSLNQDTPGHWAIHQCDHPWGRHFSRLVLELIAQHIEQGDIRYAWKWSDMLSFCGRQMDPAILSEATRLLARIGMESKLRARDTEALLATLQFRQEMRLALITEEITEDDHDANA